MKLYRLMKAASDGRPEVGTRFGMLGVRPRDPRNPRKRFDVRASVATDIVHPGEGLSVNTNQNALRPPDDEFLIWEIEDSELGNDLEVCPASPPHYLIGPLYDMTLDELQQHLAGTRDHWQRV
jgi:hypothetical protein